MRWRTIFLVASLLLFWTGAALYAQPNPPAPTGQPAAQPTAQPAAQPTAQPAAQPTAQPGQPAPTAQPAAGPADTPEPGAEAADQPDGEPATTATGAAEDATPTRAQLLDLHIRVDDLKEQIRRTHTILSLLNAELFDDNSAGGHLTVRLYNRFGSYFRVRRALVVLDGAVQYRGSSESDKLDEKSIIRVFDGPIQPGDHTLQVVLNLQGHGYGIWSYFKGYHFELRSSHSFTVTSGKTSLIRIIGYDQGDLTTAFQERPGVRYSERVSSGLQPASRR